MEQNNKLVLFQEKTIRRVWHNEEWHFSLVDIMEILTDSPIPKTYWSKLKTKIGEESQTYPNTVRLKMTATDGKQRQTDCANTEGVLRIIMSVPSPKAEPFKLWLSQLGRERMEEIENPELAAERAAELYRLKGYPPEWIERRMQSIETRKQLTNEWKKRGVEDGQEYSILTAEIAKATFGVTPSQHADLKGLKRENLRDHMTNLELIFTALGEESTRLFTVQDDAQGFMGSHDAAQKGGRGAGNALENFEKTTGQKVLSDANYLGLLGEKKKQNALGEAKEESES